ncbi:MAG: response regulator [Chitinophagaceae bacterium]|nr:response regulator [Oligoflexus sp.]
MTALAQQYFPNQDITTAQETTNILGIQTAIIVDNDSSVQRELKKVLDEMGVESINVFDDGLAALQFLEGNPNPDLIIHEWKISKITGPLFLQRARDHGEKNSPFIACSSLIEKNDIPFLREMGIAHVLKKPIQRAELIKGVAWTIQQDRRPTDRVALERKIRQKIKQRNLSAADEFVALYLNEPAIPVSAKQLVRAEIAYAEGNFEKARDFALDAMKQGGESIFVLNLLGKTMLQLRVMETALKCFERAQKLAPANIERLCQLAEIYAEVGDESASEAALQKVDDLDVGGEKADESRAKIAITQGDSTSAKSIMEHLESIDSIIAYMNNRAIAMARCGMVAEGILQYKRTIESIPDNHPEVCSIVNYNLALAYLRDQQTDLAKECLKDPVHKQIDRMKDKVNKLLVRILTAESKGELLQMSPLQAQINLVENLVPDSKELPVDSHTNGANASNAVLMAIENRPGDHGVYLLYRCSIKTSEGSKMLAGNVQFRPRLLINKDDPQKKYGLR